MLLDVTLGLVGSSAVAEPGEAPWTGRTGKQPLQGQTYFISEVVGRGGRF